jgi:four helix bundle protein
LKNLRSTICYLRLTITIADCQSTICLTFSSTWVWHPQCSSRDVDQTELKERTGRFALDVLDFCRSIRNIWEGRRIGDQLFDAASSVAASYRSACRGRSKAEFIARLGIVVEEADESEFWLAFAGRARLGNALTRGKLLQEAGELLAIFSASQITAKYGRE